MRPASRPCSDALRTPSASAGVSDAVARTSSNRSSLMLGRFSRRSTTTTAPAASTARQRCGRSAGCSFSRARTSARRTGVSSWMGRCGCSSSRSLAKTPTTHSSGMAAALASASRPSTCRTIASAVRSPTPGISQTRATAALKLAASSGGSDVVRNRSTSKVGFASGAAWSASFSPIGNCSAIGAWRATAQRTFLQVARRASLG